MHERIVNSETLTASFGGWPSFHDAEVVALRLDRGDKTRDPWLETDIHVWQGSPEVDARGYFVGRLHTLVTLRFEGVDELWLYGLNHQNALWDLELEDLSELETAGVRWGVGMPTSFGLAGNFVCAGIAVVAARPYAVRERTYPAE